jgi:PhoH-like ATPase
MAKRKPTEQPAEKKTRSRDKQTGTSAHKPDEQLEKPGKAAPTAAKNTKAKPANTTEKKTKQHTTKTIEASTKAQTKVRDRANQGSPKAEKKTLQGTPLYKAKLVNPTVVPAKKPIASTKQKGEKKIFVLDTSVILYNHNSINSFEDNDIAIPITVLEELDQFKKGNDTINFEAREFIRIMDRLSDNTSLSNWIPLDNDNKGSFKVVMNDIDVVSLDAEKIFGERKGDHRILNAALQLKRQYPDRKVIMVTKDVNLRIKAKALNLPAEDFMTGKIENVDSLYSGISRYENVDPRGISRLYSEGLCEYPDLGIELPAPNQYLILQANGASALGYYNPRNQLVERLDKHQVSKITPRNAEQVFALHAVTNPNIKLVTLQGVAGTGKTLVALAGAWNQRRNYKQIYLARPIVPLSNKDIGFLPGDFKSKIDPYMQPLYDNLKFIQNQHGEHDKEFQNITGALESEKLVIQALAFIRGRSISNVFFIVDEAQNLTPHEVKTIITRAGEGTKIVFTGDIYQIDTPYLDAQSNGLSYLIDRIKHHDLHAHVRLEKGERSDLANLANELL